MGIDIRTLRRPPRSQDDRSGGTHVKNRRSFLRNLAITSASMTTTGGITGCLRRESQRVWPTAPAVGVNLPEDSCHLPPVRVYPDRVIRSVVGLRPYRPSGFRVEREQIGEAIVIHNYGHGGGGITLCWGTSKLAVDLGAPGHTGPVAVLGAGTVGLTTARLLQDAGFDVTIYTKALPPETTSNIAGGQWAPTSVYESPTAVTQSFTDQYIYACRFAYERYQILTATRFGVRWMRNYILHRRPRMPNVPATGNQQYIETSIYDLMPEVKVIPQGEHPFGNLYCAQFDGMLIEPPLFLDALTTDFRIAGGHIILREMRTQAELTALSQKLIFNCTGLGAKALFGDADLTPIRGQLTFLVPQPEVTYATVFEDVYMFSRHDGILLGGTHEEGDWSLEGDQSTVRKKLTKQADLFGHMQSCRGASR
jgi:D-amino-acid oxidase